VRICQLGDLDELPALIESLKGVDGGAAPARAGVTARPAPLAARPIPPSAPAPPASQSQVPASPAKKKAELARDTDDDGADDDRINAALNGAADDESVDYDMPAETYVERRAVPAHAPPPREPVPAPAAAPVHQGPPLNPASVQQLWRSALAQLTGMLAAYASKANQFEVRGADFLVATFPKNYNQAKVFCEKPEQVERIQRTLSELAGRNVRVGFDLSDTAVETAQTATPQVRPTNQRERVRDKSKHPLVARAIELFDARPIKVDDQPT